MTRYTITLDLERCRRRRIRVKKKGEKDKKNVEKEEMEEDKKMVEKDKRKKETKTRRKARNNDPECTKRPSPPFILIINVPPYNSPAHITKARIGVVARGWGSMN